MSTRRARALAGLCTGVMLISGTLAVRAFPLQGPADEPRTAKRVAGDVAGGVAGGVRGGIDGGVPGGVDGDAKKKPEARKGARPRKLVSKVDPEFPYAEGKKVRSKTDVVLQLRIEKSGEVSDVKVLKGHPAFNASAVDAVKQWKFEPSEESPALATVTIRFVPPPPAPPPAKK